MRVLVVLAQPPLPEGSAPGRCAVGLLQGLEENGVDVRAVAARWRPQDSAPPHGGPPVEIIDVEDGAGLVAKARALRYPRGRLAFGTFGDRVRELARDADVVHLEEAATGWCALGVSTAVLTHFHYLTRLDRRARRSWHGDLLLRLEHLRADRLLSRRNRYLLASSPLVATELRRLAPEARVFEAPLSLDPSNYGRAALDGPPVAGLIGTAAWPSTHDAIERAVTAVWPAVRREVPGATLRIAGYGTDELGVAGDGIDVLGAVESSSTFLAGLSVLLYPPTRGSGMKVKVLEAMASGVPVVTTAAGADGIGPCDGVVVADSDEQMAAATVGILRDADERRARGSAARAVFRARFSPSVATSSLLDAYRIAASGEDSRAAGSTALGRRAVA